MRRFFTLLLIAGSVVACGGASRPAATPSTATPTATPSGSFLTIAQAADAYSAVAGPYNDAIDRAQKRYSVRASLEDEQRYWASIAKAHGLLLEGLKKITFPPEVQADAAVLIRAEDAFQERAVATSRARSRAEVLSLSAVANAAADVAAAKAGILRAGLGLGPST